MTRSVTKFSASEALVMLWIINKKMAQRFCALRQMFKTILGVGNYGVKPSFSAVPPAGSFYFLSCSFTAASFSLRSTRSAFKRSTFLRRSSTSELPDFDFELKNVRFVS